MAIDFTTSAGYVQKTQVKDLKQTNAPLFSFRKMFRTLLTQLKVVYYDCSCPNDNPTGGFPVRMNPAKTHLEYFNGTAWVNTP